MDSWLACGPHRYRVDGDMLYWYPSGEVLPEHVDKVCALLRHIGAVHGYALWLIDALHSIPVGYESRRRYAHWLTNWQGAIYGAAFRAQLPAKTTAQLTTRAVQLSSPTQLIMQTFDTESEARSYLSMQAAAQRKNRETRPTTELLPI